MFFNTPKILFQKNIFDTLLTGGRSIEIIYLIFIPAIVAGIVQGVTGFGAGVVMMIFIPLLFNVTQSAAISSSICVVLSIAMGIRYHKYINFKSIVLPAIFYIAISSISIVFSKSVDQELMKIILGLFLIVLSIYFLFFNKNEFEAKGIIAIIFIAISGVCDGLFGIGGPLMVIYFLSRIKDQKSYLGTIQCFFMITTAYNTVFRIINQIILPSHIPYILVGMVAILIGMKAANMIVDKLNPDLIKKITYVVIGLSGLINVVTTIM